MDAVTRWLTIPDRHPFQAGPLRWSAGGDAVECSDGTTFALRPAIADFVEGFGSRAPLPQFPYILQLLSLLGRGPLGLPTPTVPLRRAFMEAGRPLRTAGAFCARLCEQVPRPAEAVRFQDVCARLRAPGRLVPFGGDAAARIERPPLTPEQFERTVLEALAGYAPTDLKRWLQTDHPSPEPAAEDAGERIVEATRRTLSEAFDELLTRPGLAGAVPYVDQLLGALTVPPRRLGHGRLPVGGYSDLTNRGRFEQLLPTQLALEGPEFVRRFAENELLYYRREDPGRRPEPELIAVLDQGVRTWGGVRLVLAAAVAALARSAVRRKAEFRFACTSMPGEIHDPTTLSAEQLAEAVGSADLSSGPAQALAPALQAGGGGPRDVVLLTHPRNLAAAEVRSIGRKLPDGTRLFALTVDGAGRAEFSELRSGDPVSLTVFRVDPAVGVAASQAGDRRDGSKAAEGVWSGNVEPAPYPFLIGPVHGVEGELAEFVGDDRWLAAVARGGAIHLWPLDGSRGEIAPRATAADGSAMLNSPEALFGTPDGFVVAGRCADQPVVAHYSLETRRCRVHHIPDDGRGGEIIQWHYFRELHAVAAVQRRAVGLDLATGERHDTGAPVRTAGSRAHAACVEAALRPRPLPGIAVYYDLTPVPAGTWGVHLDRGGGLLTLSGPGGCVFQFAPQADGKARLAGHDILSAKQAGSVLALVVRPIGGSEKSLLEIDGPRVVSDQPRQSFFGFAAISHDGRHTVRSEGSGLAVYEVGGPAAPVLSVHRGKCHQDLQLELGLGWMRLSVGNLVRLLRWNQGPLAVSYTPNGPTDATTPATYGLAAPGMVASRAHLVPWISERFRSAVAGGLTAGVDRLGQVAMMVDGRVIAMFFMFRDQFALWMPDGTRWGPESLTGAAPSPDAMNKAGAALRAAQKRGEP